MIAQLKRLYINTCSMENLELKIMVQLENYNNRSWSLISEKHGGMIHIAVTLRSSTTRFFRKDSREMRGRGAALRSCKELLLRNCHEWVQSLWEKIKDQNNKGYLIVVFYYRPLDHGEPVDEAFLLYL